MLGTEGFSCYLKGFSSLWTILISFHTNYNLLGQWLNFKLLEATYLVEKTNLKLLFQGPLAKWDKSSIFKLWRNDGHFSRKYNHGDSNPIPRYLMLFVGFPFISLRLGVAPVLKSSNKSRDKSWQQRRVMFTKRGFIAEIWYWEFFQGGVLKDLTTSSD